MGNRYNPSYEIIRNDVWLEGGNPFFLKNQCHKGDEFPRASTSMMEAASAFYEVALDLPFSKQPHSSCELNSSSSC